MRIPIVLLVLACLGVIDAAYLTYVHIFSGGACGHATACSQVLTSTYASIGGTPVAGFGLGFYFAVLIAAWRSIWPDQRAEAVRWISILGIPGSLIALGFVYLQAAVIEAYCPYCLLSACLVLTLTVLAILYRRNTRTLSPFFGPLNSLHLIPVILALIGTPLLARGLHHGSNGSRPVADLREVVARINDREITLEEMDKGIALKLYETRSGYRKEWLERQLLETAAEEAGMEARAFIEQEVYARISVTTAEIDRRYGEIKSRLPGNVTKEMVTPNIRNEIANRKRKGALDAFVRALEKRYGTSYAAPESERFTVSPNARRGPEKGSVNAPVTIVEYSDLECGHCSRAHAYLNDLVKRRESDIRLIYKHYPLNMHPHAFFAAEVAACAHKQDMFWPLADVLFTRQKDFSEEEIRAIAEQIGLDGPELNACLESGDGRRVVEADQAEGDALGVSSTPSFFVNGHYIGSLPPEGLDGLIDQELGSTGHSHR